MKTQLVVDDLDDVVLRKLLKMKDNDQFTSKTWGEWFSFLTRDVFLSDSAGEMIQKSTRENLLRTWCSNLADNLPSIRGMSALLGGMSALLENLPSIQVMNTIRDLAPPDSEADKILGPCVVVGRGPSLFKHQHLKLLGESGFKGVVITSDGALIECLKNGVVPNYVVSVDGNRDLIWRWYDHPLVEANASRIASILCVTVANNVLKHIQKIGMKIYWFNPQFDDWRRNESFTKLQMLLTASEKNPNGAPNVACLPKGTLVYTLDGPIPIERLKVGQYVHSFFEPKIEANHYMQIVPKDSQLYRIPHTRYNLCTEMTPAKIGGVYYTGKKQVFLLVTKTRVIRATADHRFLTLEGWNKLQWRHLSDLKVGDGIAVTKSIKHYGSLLNMNKDMLRLLGCYLGDGWSRVRERGGEFNLSLHDDVLLAKYTTIIEKLFGKQVKVKDGTLNVYSKALAQLIVEYGLMGKAKTKTIPSWVFTLGEEETLAFLEGYIDADAYTMSKPSRWPRAKNNMVTIRFEMCNQTLANQLRFLTIKVGWRTSKPWSRVRNHKIWNGYKWYEYKDSRSYCFDCYPFAKRQYRSLQDIHPNWLRDSEFIGIERIELIEQQGIEEVYDITVEKTHNFIAEGIIVHNCLGNAGATAWVMAHALLRCSPIALIGMDMGYLPDTPPEETSYYKAMMEGTGNNINLVMQSYGKVHNPFFNCDGVDDAVFRQYRDSFLSALGQINPQIRTVNCTEGGCLFSEDPKCSLEYMRFADFLRQYGGST